ncbi:type I-C CRISPR-associated protein Cas8c/Csd1 [Lacticaseibacillus daqingensis]|uniref:type I-C CRISPR-associated protein Cas8c/Csd1 n=1 Tax=Lacticaseibacillus daqingensis TaxID=2486014 RepID=UPI0013DE55A5|nr:type I-C CRISPR-associated protein Cas8c/Csd1 [Lacticaseibacillus daqingensis]
MTIYQELVATFDENADEVGRFDSAGQTLMPLAHVSVKVDYQISINEAGKFVGARALADDERLTVIPATITAAGRANNVAAFPLHDKIKYVAGDFAPYAGDKAKRARECYLAYQQTIKDWAADVEAPPIVKAVATYTAGATVMVDLLAQFDDAKAISRIEKGESFIRFALVSLDVSEETPWRDKRLFEAWQAYYLPVMKRTLPEAIDYLTGNLQPEAPMLEKNIYPTASSAKLISANDGSGFSYRGMFLDTEFYHIGLESSQKMTHALKWLIQRQGIMLDSRVFLVWTRGGDAQSQPAAGVFRLVFEGPRDLAGQEVATAYHDALFKRVRALPEDQSVNVLFLDAATTGRMSVVYYDLMQSGTFRANLLQWNRGATIQCSWGVFTPSLNQVIESAYLIGAGGQRYTAIRRRATSRLALAIINGRPVPDDIRQAIYRRISKPVGYTNVTRGQKKGADVWTQDVLVYDSLLNYNSRFLDKEKMDMSLNEHEHDRSYVFGRLLAIADFIETRARTLQSHTSGAGTTRLTTALRFYASFIAQPSTTWNRIAAAMMTAYLPRVTAQSERERYMGHWQQATEQFEDNAMKNDDPLTGNVFKGFMDQRTALQQEAAQIFSERQATKVNGGKDHE